MEARDCNVAGKIVAQHVCKSFPRADGDRILVLTPKPTTVKAEIKVDLPRPRDFADPAFVRIREQVTEMIKWW